MAPKRKRSAKVHRKTRKAVSPRRKSRGTLATAKKGLFETLEQINKIISRFEGEVESLLKKFVKQGERSRKDLRKNFEVLVGKVRAEKLLALTREGREELEKEVRRLGEEVIGTLKEVESLIPHEKFKGLFSEAREGLLNLVDVFVDNGFLVQARQTVLKTRKEILGLLSIPTQSEVEKLERKIVKLEKRLSNLARRAA